MSQYSVFCVTVIFSVSWGPISWVYMAEVMPMQIRARRNAFATGIGNWLTSGLNLLAQVSPTALKALTWKFYFLFAAWNVAITFPIVFFLFKETKQVSLEDIDLLFGERALGTLPDDLHKGVVVGDGVVITPTGSDVESKPVVKVEDKLDESQGAKAEIPAVIDEGEVERKL